MDTYLNDLETSHGTPVPCCMSKFVYLEEGETGLKARVRRVEEGDAHGGNAAEQVDNGIDGGKVRSIGRRVF